MKITRRRLIKKGIANSTGLAIGSSLGLLPTYALSNNSQVMNVSFSGTACTRDEGEKSRRTSDKRIYLPESGYIPVRINKELGGYTRQIGSDAVGQTVRGVGENDWNRSGNISEPLKVDGPLDISKSNSLASDIRPYTSGNQYSRYDQLKGNAMPALALHGANLAADSGAQTYNLIGHSRGACECIMAAWFLYAYGNERIRRTPVNIFAIDPVPGTGEWYGILTQLPPNVVNFVGIYAWDHVDGEDHSGHPFQALVPRPNGRMRSASNDITLHDPSWWDWLRGEHDWKAMANDAQQRDPLKAARRYPQPTGYELYACRGRHSTVAGNTTADAQYDPSNISENVAPVPALIYKMARGYFTKWGTEFTMPCAVPESVVDLRKKIHLDHRDFDKMGGGETRDSLFPLRPLVRRVSSIYGRNPYNNYYLDDVAGDPPYQLTFPVTKDRHNAGWVEWKFL